MNQSNNQSTITQSAIETINEIAPEDLSVQNAEAINGGVGSNANIQNVPHQL